MQQVIVFSKNLCRWCDDLKIFLRANNIKFLELNIEDNETAGEIAISQQFKTMPQVLADGRFIGGHDAAVDYFSKQQKENHV